MKKKRNARSVKASDVRCPECGNAVFDGSLIGEPSKIYHAPTCSRGKESVIERHPILFSAPMIHAILEGRKWQTRRIVRTTLRTAQRIHDRVRCPYGKPGHYLWVRETFGIVKGNGIRVVYRADGDPPEPALGCAEDNGVKKMKWTPSIYMRPSQSRITLEVLGVRVERLQSITEADARAEGMPLTSSYREAFAHGWDQINGKRGPWKTSPFVWVVEFRRAR